MSVSFNISKFMLYNLENCMTFLKEDVESILIKKVDIISKDINH